MLMAWETHQNHHTLSITTTTRQYYYAALRATSGSTICIHDDAVLPQNVPTLGALANIHHAHAKLGKRQFCVVLEGGSRLTGANQITCTMLNLKNEVVPVPEERAIVAKEED